MPRPTLKQARSALKVSRRFVRNAIQRRANPQKFIENGLTPFEELTRDRLFAVRYYPPFSDASIAVEGEGAVPVSTTPHRVPLLMVPPLGTHTWIFDLMSDRSIVRYFRARGFEVYLIDWGVPTSEDHNLSLDTYVNRWMPAAIDTVRKHSGQQDVALLGYCMGGLLSLMALGAKHDPHIKALVTIASPVDFHGGPTYGRLISTLSKPAMIAHRLARIRLIDFDAQRFHVPGWMVSLGFRSMNPPGMLMAYLGMVRHLADTDYVTEYMSMGQWFNDMVDYPGTVVQEMAEKLAIANQLASGGLRIGGALIDLRNVRADLFACAGAGDTIVDVEMARRVLKVVGSSDRTFHIGPGGHAALFSGSSAPSHVWKPIADWLVPRSA